MHRTAAALAVILFIAVAPASMQQRRPASPEGTAAAQVDGKWMEILYGRPILRGRTSIFGSGAEYGVKLNDGGPVWRAGANTSTRLVTELPLEIGGRRVPPGEYVMLIELRGDNDWTFILTAQSYTAQFDPKNTTDLYGGYNYKPDKDVARARMNVERLPFSVEQLTWVFTDVTPTGGAMRIAWERMMASVPFKIVQ